MWQPELQIIDPYQAQRRWAEQRDRVFFQEWKNLVWQHLLFDFCNSKAISCINSLTNRKIIIIADTETKIQVLSSEYGNIILEILEDSRVIPWKLHIDNCVSFFVNRYTNIHGSIVHQDVSMHENFLPTWFKEV